MALARFFGTGDVTWTITTSQTAVPQLVRTQRTYAALNQITKEIDDARVWAGLHWRNSMKDGDKLGARLARHVLKNYFRAEHGGD